MRRPFGVFCSVLYDIIDCLAVGWLPKGILLASPAVFCTTYCMSSCWLAAQAALFNTIDSFVIVPVLCFVCTDRVKTNLSFPTSLTCLRQSLQKAKSFEKIPAASDEIKKAVLEQRRAIILAIIGATPENSPSLDRVLSNDYLSGVKVWLDQVLDGSVGELRVRFSHIDLDQFRCTRSVFLSMLFLCITLVK
jgi:hypothetical protein